MSISWWEIPPCGEVELWVQQMKGEQADRLIWFSLLPRFHDLCWQKQRRAAVWQTMLSGSGTLGMVRVPVFPGPLMDNVDI